MARQAFEAGAKVIALRGKGFSPLCKPGGKHDDRLVAEAVKEVALVGLRGRQAG